MDPLNAMTLLTLCFVTTPPDRPPPLTFDKPVDYTAWYNDFVSNGKKKNALDLYKGLYPDASGKGGIPAPQGKAEEQLKQALSGNVWTPKASPKLAAYLKDCSSFLKIIEKAAELPHYWHPAPPATSPLLALMLPELMSSRTAAKALLAQASMKQDDQSKALIDAARVVLRNADHLQQAGLLISVLTGTAQRAHLYEAARAALAANVVSGRSITALYRTIHKFDPGAPNLARSCQVEWAICLDAIQWLFPDGKLDAARWKTVTEMMSNTEQTVSAPPVPTDPRESAKIMDEHFARLLDLFSQPLSVETAGQIAEYEAKQKETYEKDPCWRTLAPSLSRAYVLQIRTETARRATLLALAIHAHHAEHDKWPESLAKIDKKLGLKGLEDLLIDPFSGKPFVYQMKDGEPLLYSVLQDGKDDGGRHDPKWGEADPNSDFVFWPYQRRQ